MSASISLLSTNLSSFYVPMPNLSSPEIQRNNHNNLISDNAGNDKVAKSETAKSVLNIGQSTIELIRTTYMSLTNGIVKYFRYQMN